MARRKNTKRIDPRYFMDEKTEDSLLQEEIKRLALKVMSEGLGDWVKGLFSGGAKPTRDPSLPEWFGKRPPTQEEAYALIMSPDPGGRRMKAMQQASIDILQNKAKSGEGLSMDEKFLAQMMQADLEGVSDEDFMKMTDEMADEAAASLPPHLRKAWGV